VKKLKRITLLPVMLLVCVGVLAFAYSQNNTLEVSQIHVSSDRAGTIRIVHLSDIHGKQFGKENARLTEAIIGQNPDLVVITGDTIDHPTKNLDEMVGFLDILSKSYPVIVISGNHERGLSVRDDFFRMLREVGVTVLENEIYTVHVNESVVQVLGLDERLREPEDIIRRQLHELEELPGLRVVLAHYPQRYSIIDSLSYSEYDFDLMFAGHAHGGQWNLPIIGGVYSPGQGLMPKYYRGLYDDRLVVSAGLGNAHFPLRLFNYPQIIVVQIN
jgi:predicted MPP superfamily phosphohydrolase